MLQYQNPKSSTLHDPWKIVKKNWYKNKIPSTRALKTLFYSSSFSLASPPLTCFSTKARRESKSRLPVYSSACTVAELIIGQKKARQVHYEWSRKWPYMTLMVKGHDKRFVIIVWHELRLTKERSRRSKS